MKIEVDNNDIRSIKKADRKKTALENKGYTLTKTIQVGLSKFIMIYNK